MKPGGVSLGYALAAMALCVCSVLNLFIASATGKGWPIVVALLYGLAAVLLWIASQLPTGGEVE